MGGVEIRVEKGQEQTLKLSFCFFVLFYFLTLKSLVRSVCLHDRKTSMISSKELYANKCKEMFPLPIYHMYLRVLFKNQVALFDILFSENLESRAVSDSLRRWELLNPRKLQRCFFRLHQGKRERLTSQSKITEAPT